MIHIDKSVAVREAREVTTIYCNANATKIVSNVERTHKFTNLSKIHCIFSAFKGKTNHCIEVEPVKCFRGIKWVLDS